MIKTNRMKVAFYLPFLFLWLIVKSQTNPIGIAETFKTYANTSAGSNNGTMVNLSPIEDTKGSPYLLNSWATGAVQFNNGNILSEPTNSLNYDKISHQLIVKLSEKEILSVNMNDIKSFSLKDSLASLNFIKIPQISSTYVIQLYQGKSYSLYKSIDTKFYKSDYQNKGLYETGEKFDRYIDKPEYFIIDNTSRIYDIHNGNKSELKKLALSLPGVKSYIKDVNNNAEAEIYLTDLVIYINSHK